MPTPSFFPTLTPCSTYIGESASQEALRLIITHWLEETGRPSCTFPRADPRLLPADCSLLAQFPGWLYLLISCQPHDNVGLMESLAILDSVDFLGLMNPLRPQSPSPLFHRRIDHSSAISPCLTGGACAHYIDIHHHYTTPTETRDPELNHVLRPKFRGFIFQKSAGSTCTIF